MIFTAKTSIEETPSMYYKKHFTKLWNIRDFRRVRIDFTTTLIFICDYTPSENLMFLLTNKISLKCYTLGLKLIFREYYLSFGSKMEELKFHKLFRIKVILLVELIRRLITIKQHNINIYIHTIEKFRIFFYILSKHFDNRPRFVLSQLVYRVNILLFCRQQLSAYRV